MSDNLNKEFASALKWVIVIVIAAFAYNSLQPQYYFMRDKYVIIRGNTHTGKIEYTKSIYGSNLGYDRSFRWVDITESPLSKEDVDYGFEDVN